MGEMFDENKLMIVNNNELELTKDGIKFIKKMQKAKIELAKMEEQLKENFKYLFEETGTNKFVSEDGILKQHTLQKQQQRNLTVRSLNQIMKIYTINIK